MMRYAKLLALMMPIVAIAACEDDPGVTDQGPPKPAALVRFINAVPDTGTVDLRFVDKVENLPTLQGVAFRAASGLYQRVEPGSRAARIFPNATDAALTSIFLVDTTVTLVAPSRVTMVYAGRATGNQDRLAVISDPDPATPPAGQIALKALHVAVGTGPVDVYIVPVTSTTAATPADFATSNAGVIRNVGYLNQSAYVNAPARPSGGHYRFVVTAAGSTTALFAATPNQPGVAAPAGQSYGAQPGMQIAGSAMTVVVAAGATPGTRQSTTAMQTPTVFVVADKTLDP